MTMFERPPRYTVKNMLPVVFVLLTMFVIWYPYVSIHLAKMLQLDQPMETRDPNTFRRGLVETVVSQTLVLMMFICYWCCVFTEPGTTPDDPEWLPDNAKQMDRPFLNEVKQTTGRRRHCKWCGRWKPDRCHHCRLCRCCVLKMDHHCPWIMNCVGYHNHKYFFLTVLYSCMACLFITISMVEAVQRSRNTDVQLKERFFVVFSMTISLFMGFLLTGFLAFHTWLAFHEKTTIEFCEKVLIRGHTSVYDLGIWRNLHTLFGPNPLFWLLPMSPPVGNGVHHSTATFVAYNPQTAKLKGVRSRASSEGEAKLSGSRGNGASSASAQTRRSAPPSPTRRQTREAIVQPPAPCLPLAPPQIWDEVEGDAAVGAVSSADSPDRGATAPSTKTEEEAIAAAASPEWTHFPSQANGLDDPAA